MRVTDLVAIIRPLVDGARRRSFASAEFSVMKDSIPSPQAVHCDTVHATAGVLTQTPDESKNHRLNGAVPRQQNRKVFAALGVWQRPGFAFSNVEHRTRSQHRSLASTSGDDENASNRIGRKIGEDRTTRSAVRSSHSPGRPQRLRAPEVAHRLDAVAARNCKWARELGKAQSYLCPRSSAEQFQTRMRTPPMP